MSKRRKTIMVKRWRTNDISRLCKNVFRRTEVVIVVKTRPLYNRSTSSNILKQSSVEIEHTQADSRYLIMKLKMKRKTESYMTRPTSNFTRFFLGVSGWIHTTFIVRSTGKLNSGSSYFCKPTQIFCRPCRSPYTLPLFQFLGGTVRS